MNEALANFVMAGKETKEGKKYYSPRIYLPTKLVTDSSFPLKEGKVYIRVKGRRLTIEKATSRSLKKFGISETS